MNYDDDRGLWIGMVLIMVAAAVGFVAGAWVGPC
jgi:hypothetical protein